MKFIKLLAVSTVLMFNSACSSTGGPVVLSDADFDHKVHVGRALTDSEPLSVQVLSLLKSNGQTALARIEVSQPGPDTVRLAGTVDDSSTLHEAERLAYQAEGVRFVVNTLQIRR